MTIFEESIDIGLVKVTGYQYENMAEPTVWLEYEEYNSWGGSSTRTVDITKEDAIAFITYLQKAFNL